MKTMIQNFINDESGATMVEYAILVALISVAVIAAVLALRVAITDAFQSVVDCLNDPAGCEPAAAE